MPHHRAIGMEISPFSSSICNARKTCDAALEGECQAGHRQLHSGRAKQPHVMPGLGKHCPRIGRSSWMLPCTVSKARCIGFAGGSHDMAWLMPDRCSPLRRVVPGGSIE
ncbi:hypothetical protein BDW75DRAFT_15768 [Aspergillus navahoensis]